MKKNIYTLTACQITDRFLKGKISACEIAAAFSQRINTFEKQVMAWAFFDEHIFMRQAEEIDKKTNKLLKGRKLPAVPVGVKDIFNTFDMPTCMGSVLWKGYNPGNDARAVFNLRYEGGMVAGKTVTAEFAVHEPGLTRNPHNLRYYPGTSSSGSSAAVACGMVPVALGTQTAGSIIRPASYCGVYGFKPTFGLIPRTAVLKTTDTLDQIGWFARNISDIELLFDVLRVKGQNYPYVYSLIDKKPDSYFKRRKWRVIFLEHPKWEFAENYAKEAIKDFVSRLKRNKNIDVAIKKLPREFNVAHDVHDTIYNKTLSYYFKDEQKQNKLVSKVLLDLIKRGKSISVEEYQNVMAKQVYLRQLFKKFMLRSGDLIITLATSGEASLFESPEDKPDSCLIWSLCGVPSLNIPVFRGPHGLPFGLQLIALPYFDNLIFNFVRMLESLGYIKGVFPIHPRSGH